MATKREIVTPEEEETYQKLRAKRARIAAAVRDGSETGEDAREIHEEVEHEELCAWRAVRERIELKAEAAELEAKNDFIADVEENDWVTGELEETPRRHGETHERVFFVASRGYYDNMPAVVVLSEYHGEYDDANLTVMACPVHDHKDFYDFKGTGAMFSDACVQESVEEVMEHRCRGSTKL